MKTHYRRVLAVVLILFSLDSCTSKGVYVDDGSGGGGPHVFNPTDITAPDITIYTPTTNQVFSSGNTINITGKLTDDYGLYRGTIRLINDATGYALINQPYEIHGFKSYDFNVMHNTSVTVASDYTVVVSFEDHGLNVTTKSVKVKVNP